MKILAIVDVTSSNLDMYGNCYHIAEVTNTITGETKTFVTDAPSNASSLVKNTLETTYPKDKNARYKAHVSCRDVPIKQFNRMHNGLPYERDINMVDLLSPKKGKKA
jgi:hypothetical protein